MPVVQRVESLFSAPHIKSDGLWVDTTPLFSDIPDTVEEIEARRTEALTNPLLRDVLYSSKAPALAITLFLEPESEVGTSEAQSATYQLIQNALSPYQGAFDQLFQTGGPALRHFMVNKITEDQKRILPWSGLALVLLIGGLLRSFQAALLTIINAAITSLLTLGLMSYLGIPMTLLTSMIPALVLIIGSTEDVHILSEYQQLRAAGEPNEDAVRGIAKELGLTLLLTGMTTTIGFGATALSPLGIVRDFGLMAAFAMVTRLLISMSLVPAWLRWFGPWMNQRGGHLHDPVATFETTSRETNFLLKRFVNRPYRTLAGFILIAAPCVAMMPRIELSNDLLSFLPQDTPAIQELQTVNAQLSGTKVLHLTLNRDAGDYQRAQPVQQLAQICDWLRQDPRIDHLTSLSDYIKLMHAAMLPDSPRGALPDNDALLAQYYLFLHRNDLRPYVDGSFGRTAITLRTSISNSAELNQLARDIEQTLRSQRFGPLDFRLTGESLLVSRAVDDIVFGQSISLLAITALLFTIVSILFVSARAGMMATLSNLFPAAVLFGVMALAGIPFNVGTCMIAAVTMGIAVDDTLHLMTRYNRALRSANDERIAIELAMQAEFTPVCITSLSLAGGFAILGLSGFVPIQQFGLLSAAVMFLALVADLIMTPVLLSTVRLLTLWDILGVKTRKRLMAESPFFQGLTAWEAKKVMLLANLETRPAGSYIMREGTQGKYMYVLIDGEMAVQRNFNGQEHIIAHLQPGEIVGEIALVADVPRTADVVCLQPCQLLELDWEKLERLRRASPRLSAQVYLNMASILGDRMRGMLDKEDEKK